MPEFAERVRMIGQDHLVRPKPTRAQAAKGRE